jgi:chorismate-pyruvate lyase
LPFRFFVVGRLSPVASGSRPSTLNALCPVNSPSRHPSEADLYARSVSRLASLFYEEKDELGRFEPVPADELPDEYRSLLAHHDHMTVALEAYHNSLVEVKTLAEWKDEASYARNSLLARQSDGTVLQFGIMRIWLGDLPVEVREEITARRMPLGRVLIRHNMLREVELITLWRITPGPVLQEHLGVAEGQPIYGRSAQILVDERPTVQVLEIVAL